MKTSIILTARKKLKALKYSLYLILSIFGFKDLKTIIKKLIKLKYFDIYYSKKHRAEPEIMTKVFANFEYRQAVIAGKNRRVLKGVDAGAGVTEQTLSKLYQLLKNNPKKNKLLSIGCGMRQQLDFLRLIGFDAYGVDFDVSPKKEATKLKFHNLNENNNLPFKEKTFDFVLCQEVIEHIENPWLLMRKIKRVLKKNGILMLTTPNISSADSKGIFIGNNEGYTEHFKQEMTWYHINPLAIFEIKHLMKYNNFSLIEITGNKDYFIDFGKDAKKYNSIVNRNDILHFIYKNNDNVAKIYEPKATYSDKQ